MDLNPNVHRLDRISHTKLSSLNKKKTLVMAVQSPIEVHGPHLPLGQDLMEAEAFAERAVNDVAAERPDWSFVLLPPMPVSIDCVPHLGSLAFPVDVVRDVAYYSLRPFASQGFARLAYSSFHGSPRHICALEDAALALTNEYKAPAISLFSVVISKLIKGNIFFDAVKDTPGFSLGENQVAKDMHAGFVETSLALHLWPDLVDDGYQSLPPSSKTPEDEESRSFLFGGDSADIFEKLRAAASRIDGIVKTIKHFRESTYSGYPSESSAELGKKIFEHLCGISKDTLNEFIERGANMDAHSPLWPMRHVLLNKTANFLVDDVFKIYG